MLMRIYQGLHIDLNTLNYHNGIVMESNLGQLHTDSCGDGLKDYKEVSEIR